LEERSPRKIVSCIALLALILMASSAHGMETRVDPDTRRIKTLMGGLPHVGWAGWAEVFLFAMDDPRFDIRAPVPHLGLDTPSIDLIHARRVARIYLPRSYEDFLASTDFVLLANIDLRVFTPQNIAWFRDGVRDEGLGLLMTGGSQGFGGYGGFPSWGETFLDEILPVECLYGEQSKSYLPRLRIADPENELARSLPWEDAPCFFPYNFVIPKPGSTVILESADSKKTPLWFYWDVGQGRFVGSQNIFGVFGCDFYDWQYFQDSVLNTYYYTVALPLPGPGELVTVHEIRRKWHSYRQQTKLMVSLMEFADRFGANMRQAEVGMEGVASLRKDSDDLYLVQDYLAALDALDAAISEAGEVGELAVELKKQALVWVYVIEWFTVLATFLLSGFLLWTLMVRRALYQEVRLTGARY
jgi:hypothetical protein